MISYAETEQVRYIRLGATAPTNLKMTQIDISDDERHLEVTWDAAEDATSYILTLVNGDGSKNIVETVTGTSYTLKGVQMKERWEATLIAQNNDGKALPVEASAKIGGKIPAFLSEYATPEELIANGDDDEASAWLWFQTNYPKGEYVYFGTINRLSTSLLRGVGNAFGCGAGWTEDHNCLFFDIPVKLTDLDNTSEECYNVLTTEYGIHPLGTWDSQVSWVSQLNIWEAKGADKAPEGFQKGCGTVLCIGNGGCEFSMKNEDGTPDKSANPKNNSCQGNILKLAKNSIEYLMSI